MRRGWLPALLLVLALVAGQLGAAAAQGPETLPAWVMQTLEARWGDPEARAIVEGAVIAGRRTQVSPTYLVITAARESALRPGARARTTTAAGPFQFVERTWLLTVARHGRDHGLRRAVRHIEVVAGEPLVADPEARGAILRLRHHPLIASLMAAAFTRETFFHLREALDLTPGAAELYLAHLLGRDDAIRFIRALVDKPERPAADLFPAAAATNRALFYERNQPLALRTLHERIVSSFTPG